MDNQAKNLDSAEKLFAAPLSLPCYQDWSGMTGDDRVRLCSRCKKNVYNVSQMSRDDAVALISKKEGNLCVRFYQRPDGSVTVSDCLIYTDIAEVKSRHPILKALAWIHFTLITLFITLLSLVGPAIVCVISVHHYDPTPSRSYGEAPIVD